MNNFFIIPQCRVLNIEANITQFIYILYNFILYNIFNLTFQFIIYFKKVYIFTKYNTFYKNYCKLLLKRQSFIVFFISNRNI